MSNSSNKDKQKNQNFKEFIQISAFLCYLKIIKDILVIFHKYGHRSIIKTKKKI